MRYLIPLLVSLVVCFGAQSVALRAVGGRTVKSESNYFSSLARIQSGARGHPETMLLGSSITGRLPDRVNGFSGVANLGCDGGSAVDTLRAIDEGILQAAPTLVIEGNTIFLAVEDMETEIAGAMRSHWFSAGLRAPNLSATARPAAFAYSALMARKMGAMGAGTREGLEISSAPGAPDPPGLDLSIEENELLAELAEILRRLREQGAACVVVFYPSGRRPPLARSRELAVGLAVRAEVPFWDLTEGLADDAVRYTDGVHLNPASATKVMTTLMGRLD